MNFAKTYNTISDKELQHTFRSIKDRVFEATQEAISKRTEDQQGTNQTWCGKRSSEIDEDIFETPRHNGAHFTQTFRSIQDKLFEASQEAIFKCVEDQKGTNSTWCEESTPEEGDDIMEIPRHEEVHFTQTPTDRKIVKVKAKTQKFEPIVICHPDMPITEYLDAYRQEQMREKFFNRNLFM